MAYISFFKTYRPKQFNFTPRYYNEQKEALEQRVEKIKQEMGIESENPARPGRTLTKGVMRQQIGSKRKLQRKSTFRLLIITAILILLAYYLLYR